MLDTPRSFAFSIEELKELQKTLEKTVPAAPPVVLDADDGMEDFGFGMGNSVVPQPQFQALESKTLQDYALDAIRRGWYVLPCYPRKKTPAGCVVPHGVDDASNDEDQIRKWWAINPNFNVAIALGPSNLVVWDFDKVKPFADMAPTYTVRTGREAVGDVEGIQMYYRGSCGTTDLRDASGVVVGEIRSRGAYVMAAGCIHPKSGNPYVVINDVELAPSTVNTVAAPIVVGPLLTTDAQAFRIQVIEDSFEGADIEFENVQEHKGGFKWYIRCPWDSTHSEGRTFDTSSAMIMWGDGKMIYSCQHAHCKGIKEWKELRAYMEEKVGGKICFFDFDSLPLLEKMPDVIPVKFLDEDRREGVTHPHYDMTGAEIAIQDEEEYPVYKLRSVPGPDFDEGDLYGPLGHIAKKMCQYSEAHVATVYLNLIVSMGSMIGPGPYFNIANTKQHANEYLACVGDSSRARKGVSSDVVAALLDIVDHKWFTTRNYSGFSTAQGVLNQVRDAHTFDRLNKRTGAYASINRPGVDDKRLCIREGELSGVFKIVADSSNRAGELFRNAWDSKPISNIVAGKTEAGEHNSLICLEPHISIVGFTTPSLAKATLPVGADKSGDGNRILWCYTKRTQLSPTGGPEIDWTKEVWGDTNVVAYLLKVVERARAVKYVPIQAASTRYWNGLYQKLENDHRTGFLGGMTSRAAPHIRRIAMILALIDGEASVHKNHIVAAERAWDYSQDSARYIFVSYTLDQERILKLAAGWAPAAGITFTDVHNLFGRHQSSEWVRAQLRDLVEGGFLTLKVQQRAVGEKKAGMRDTDVFYFKKWK